MHFPQLVEYLSRTDVDRFPVARDTLETVLCLCVVWNDRHPPYIYTYLQADTISHPLIVELANTFVNLRADRTALLGQFAEILRDLLIWARPPSRWQRRQEYMPESLRISICNRAQAFLMSGFGDRSTVRNVERLRELCVALRTEARKSVHMVRSTGRFRQLRRIRLCSMGECTRSPVGVCGGCGCVRYCSRQCQREHWRRDHRRVCFPTVDLV